MYHEVKEFDATKVAEAKSLVYVATSNCESSSSKNLLIGLVIDLEVIQDSIISNALTMQ